jgi:hypothetical protein
VGWGNQINVATAAICQLEHRLSQLLNCHLVSVTMMADIKVLTKYTAQVTSGKKYGT